MEKRSRKNRKKSEKNVENFTILNGKKKAKANLPQKLHH